MPSTSACPTSIFSSFSSCSPLWRPAFSRLLALLAPVLLASCGDLPRPFAGNPGATAARLAAPPPARLVVPTPGAALLPDEASHVFAAQIVNSLVAREVPAVESDGRTGDWQLITTAELKGGRVVPTYTVKNPAGIAEGATQGPPVDAVTWSAGKPDALKQAAEAAAPPISDLLARIRAAQLQSDPNSLANRPPRVLVKEVVGAPGDGNVSLTRQMREQLTQRGQVVQETAEGADFTVEGKVRTAPAGNGMTQLDLRWVVTDAQGHDLGFAAQVNDVPAQMIQGLWGDLAVVITQEASAGLRDIILKQPGVRHTEASASGAPGATKPQP